MTTIELQALLDRVKEEIRIFERPCADNSKKMFELLTEAVKNNGVLPCVSVSFKSLLEEANDLYEKAKQAPNEREELILAAKSSMCREIAYRLLNER